MMFSETNEKGEKKDEMAAKL